MFIFTESIRVVGDKRLPGSVHDFWGDDYLPPAGDQERTPLRNRPGHRNSDDQSQQEARGKIWSPLVRRILNRLLNFRSPFLNNIKGKIHLTKNFQMTGLDDSTKFYFSFTGNSSSYTKKNIKR